MGVIYLSEANKVYSYQANLEFARLTKTSIYNNGPLLAVHYQVTELIRKLITSHLLEKDYKELLYSAECDKDYTLFTFRIHGWT